MLLFIVIGAGAENVRYLAALWFLTDLETGDAAGLARALAAHAIEAVADRAEGAIVKIGAELPEGFPESIHRSVNAAVIARRCSLRTSACQQARLPGRPSLNHGHWPLFKLRRAASVGSLIQRSALMRS